MLKYIVLFFLTSCSLLTDPVLDKDVLDIGEEVIKDELGAKKKSSSPIDGIWCEECDQKPSSEPVPLINFPFKLGDYFGQKNQTHPISD